MPSTGQSLPPATTLGRSALRVADLSAVVAFYRDVVGLRVLSRDDGRASLGAGEATLLELRAEPNASGRRGAGLYHNAFRVPSRTALGDALGRVRDRWTLDGAADHGVSEALYLSDPAENGVEIYCDRPREAWPIADDGRVAMVTDPLDLSEIAALADGESALPAATDLGHVHLEVTAIDRARAFYADALGLRVRQAMGANALFLAAGEYHHHVGLNTWNARSNPAGGLGLDWFELVVPDGDALAAARSRLEAAGVAVADLDDATERAAAGGGSPVAGGAIEVSDPDGIGVRLRAEE